MSYCWVPYDECPNTTLGAKIIHGWPITCHQLTVKLNFSPILRQGRLMASISLPWLSSQAQLFTHPLPSFPLPVRPATHQQYYCCCGHSWVVRSLAISWHSNSTFPPSSPFLPLTLAKASNAPTLLILRASMVSGDHWNSIVCFSISWKKKQR